MNSETETCNWAAEFLRGLTDPLVSAPPEVSAAPGKGVVKRYNIYRNNVTVSLIAALAAIYPAVQRITGADFFRAMARFHVRATPPKSPLLFDYGREFPAFIEAYEYAREMPWLADTARIERAWLDVYHAEDCSTLTAEALGLIHPSSLAGTHFVPHPAARVVRSTYPAVSIFAMNRMNDLVSQLSSSDAEDALITRPEQDVIVSRLPPGGAAFRIAMFNGLTLGDAIAVAFDEAPSFDLQANMTEMIAAGVFTTIQHGD